MDRPKLMSNRTDDPVCAVLLGCVRLGTYSNDISGVASNNPNPKFSLTIQNSARDVRVMRDLKPKNYKLTSHPNPLSFFNDVYTQH